MDNELSSKYTEAGRMMRHFSNVRALIISFSITAFIAVVGFVLLNLQNLPILLYLIFTELFFFVWAVIFYLHLSNFVKTARSCLQALERGDNANPHHALANVVRFKGLKLDFFDKLYLSLTTVLHVFLYLYIFFRLGTLSAVH